MNQPRILRSRVLRLALSLIILAMAGTGGDLLAHVDHVDTVATTAAHGETPSENDGGPPVHDPAAPAHHSCSVHLCFHQLDRATSAKPASLPALLRTRVPNLIFAEGRLLSDSVDHPPRISS